MTLDALTPASVHSLWSSPKCLNRLCLTVFSSLWSSLLLVHVFLPNFFLPVNFTFNMLWYSTPWTAPLSVRPSVTYNDRLLDHGQVSSVPRYCASKEQEDTHNLYCMDVIYWNSNVNIISLIFWDTDFWLSLAVSSTYFFTSNESKIYVSLFKINYKKNFFTIFKFFEMYLYILKCKLSIKKTLEMVL